MLKQRIKKSTLTTKETVIFAVLGTIMFLSKIIMEFLPNIHLLGVLTVAYTDVYRKKALIPIYVYVFLNGLFSGFNIWWIPYLYIWTLLWGAIMLIPKGLNIKIKLVLYAIICSLHGFSFGILYSPAQAVMFGLGFKAMIAWIIAGFPFDCIHGVSNLLLSVLIYPITRVLKLTQSNQSI